MGGQMEAGALRVGEDVFEPGSRAALFAASDAVCDNAPVYAGRGQLGHLLRGLDAELADGVEDPAYFHRRPFGRLAHGIEDRREILSLPEDDPCRHDDL